MNQMSEQALHDHVQLLGWLHIIGNAILLLIGAFVFLLLAGIGVVSGETEALGVLTVIGLFVGGIMLVFSLPGIIAGIGLLRRQAWGRILALIVGFFSLINFPIGTAIGLYTFWVLLQDNAPAYFER